VNRSFLSWPSSHRTGCLILLCFVLLAEGCTALSSVTPQSGAAILPPTTIQPIAPDKEDQNANISKTPRVPGPAAVVHTGQASWYGPGFNGKTTASGIFLTTQNLRPPIRRCPFVVRPESLTLRREIPSMLKSTTAVRLWTVESLTYPRRRPRL
jgi:hypothetical protein